MSPIEISIDELGTHTHDQDAWIAVNGIVWDFSGFAELHPGGEDIIRESFGKDASAVYNDIHGPNLISNHLGNGKRKGNLITQAPQDAEPSGKEILEKPPLEMMINLYDFEQVASKQFSEKSWAYIAGASDDCLTKTANEDWYRRIFIRPRILKNVAKPNTNCTLFGCKFALPIFNAPASLVMRAHPDGELAIARASIAAGGTIIVPTLSSYSLEEIIAELPAGHPWFFQLYVNPDRQRAREYLKEVCRFKPSAIMVTVDLPAFSKREANERYDAKVALEKGILWQNQARSAGDSSIASDLTWQDIQWIKEKTKVPIVVKGIQCASDAKRAYEAGCAGIYISNHGGRAEDTAQPAILTLLEIQANCPEILEKMEVLIDGGIRRGTDVLKAICLGASAVCLGRPMFYAATYGAAGVEHALNIIRDELQIAMQLAGIRELSEAHPGLLNTTLVDQYVCREKEDGRHPWAKKIIRSRM